MIHRLEISDLENCVLAYAKHVEFLNGKQSLEFTPGVNILWGRNGSGKSTVLEIMARWLCCFDGDTQLLGKYTLSCLSQWDYQSSASIPKDGVIPIHDGNPVTHFDPSKEVGVQGGSICSDFGLRGLQNIMSKGSSGENALRDLYPTLEGLVSGKFPELRMNVRPGDPHETFLREGNVPPQEKTNIPTILLDEPCRSLDLDRVVGFWQRIAEAKGVQVIVATHSPFALHVPGANYIDLSPGYLQCVRDVLPSVLTLQE